MIRPLRTHQPTTYHPAFAVMRQQNPCGTYGEMGYSAMQAHSYGGMGQTALQTQVQRLLPMAVAFAAGVAVAYLFLKRK